MFPTGTDLQPLSVINHTACRHRNVINNVNILKFAWNDRHPESMNLSLIDLGRRNEILKLELNCRINTEIRELVIAKVQTSMSSLRPE